MTMNTISQLDSSRVPRAVRALWALPFVVCASAAEPLRVSFNEHIRPILADNCSACHGLDAKKLKAELRLDVAEGAYHANAEGVTPITPGDLAKSEVWTRINSGDADEVMPPPKSHKPPLTPEQRALIKRWIEQGTVYQKHWAFEPAMLSLCPAPSAAARPRLHRRDSQWRRRDVLRHRSRWRQAAAHLRARARRRAASGKARRPRCDLCDCRADRTL